MEHPITITLIANAGVLLEYRGERLLVDGLHSDPDIPQFSSVPEPLLGQMLQGSGSLADIDFLLFTHCHGDHYSAQLTEQYLRANRVRRLVMPACQSGRDEAVLEAAQQRGTQQTLLDMPLYELRSYPLSSHCSVSAFRATHAGKEYEQVEHFCLLLEFEGRSVLVVADADYDAAYFQRVLGSREVEAALVNPLFLNKSTGRAVIEAIAPKRLLVYHIPFAQQDSYGLRRLVPRDSEKYRDTLPPVTALTEELQSVSI